MATLPVLNEKNPQPPQVEAAFLALAAQDAFPPNEPSSDPSSSHPAPSPSQLFNKGHSDSAEAHACAPPDANPSQNPLTATISGVQKLLRRGLDLAPDSTTLAHNLALVLYTQDRSPPHSFPPV